MSGRHWRWGAAAMAGVLVATEVAVRALGWVDFPVYVLDDEIGYYPQPNQSGAFMGTNRWVFNNRSMGIATPWKPGNQTDVLLIGNSVVLGGNPYDQPDKVAPQMQTRVDARCAIWPVATGGWSTVNEYRFLERQPDLVEGADFFIWEVMGHQMNGAHGWSRETVIPTHPPVWATGHVLQKLLYERWWPWAQTAPQQKAVGSAQVVHHYQQFDAMLQRLQRAAGRKPAGIIFLYPDRQQLQGSRQGLEWLVDREQYVRMAATHGLVLIDIARYPQWTDALYRDQVHPTAAGNAVLADILAQALHRALPGC